MHLWEVYQKAKYCFQQRGNPWKTTVVVVLNLQQDIFSAYNGGVYSHINFAMNQSDYGVDFNINLFRAHMLISILLLMLYLI